MGGERAREGCAAGRTLRGVGAVAGGAVVSEAGEGCDGIAPGRVIGGRFRVIEEIGRGGMGTVVAAEELRLGRRVALKFLRRGACPEDEAHFRREARLLASLAHPNVVRLFGDGEAHGRPYLVMEHLDGRPLDQILDERPGDPLPLDVALGWTRQICDALSAVHALGFVHRDVKPGNVMIQGDERAVLMDFGLAQKQRERDPEHVSGTPSYLAPEDIRGRPLLGPDARRSDVYSLGVTIFELLAGRPPFEGDDPQAVMRKHVREAPPSLAAARPDLPPAFDAILRRALAKNPSLRPASAEDLKEALLRARAGEPSRRRRFADEVITRTMRVLRRSA